MPRRSIGDTHPRIDEIDQALRDGVPLRPLSKEFGVSRSALSRRANTIGVDRRRPSLPGRSIIRPDTSSAGSPTPLPAVGSEGDSPRTHPPTAMEIISPAGSASDETLFDILSMSYPWAEGEPHTPDAVAARLRDTQRLHGIAAVKDEILHLVGRYRGTGLAAHRLARMLDVPPAIIPRWLQAKDHLDRDLLTATDPTDRAARDLAEIEDDLARVREHLANRNIGDRSFALLMTQVTRLREQRGKLLEQLGLLAPVTRDEREPRVRDLHESIMRMAEVVRLCRDTDATDETTP
jgi:hypothetical protein